MTRQPMRRTIRGGRPYFFADPAIDKVLNMVVVLASEVWTLRERLLAMEALQVRQGGLAAGEVDAFEFSADDEANLGVQRKEFIDSLFRVLAEQVEEANRVTAAKPPAKAPATAQPKVKIKPKAKTKPKAKARSQVKTKPAARRATQSKKPARKK
jgi:DNA-directed RNA polymerase subunit L